MDLRELSDKIDGVDKKILDLIDLKPREDMKEIISRMDAMERHTTNEIRIVLGSWYHWHYNVCFACNNSLKEVVVLQ